MDHLIERIGYELVKTNRSSAKVMAWVEHEIFLRIKDLFIQCIQNLLYKLISEKFEINDKDKTYNTCESEVTSTRG